MGSKPEENDEEPVVVSDEDTNQETPDNDTESDSPAVVKDASSGCAVTAI